MKRSRKAGFDVLAPGSCESARSGTASGENAQLSFWLWFVLVVLIGSFFRLYNLGGPAFRADTMTFYDVCNTSMHWHEVVSRWFDLQGDTSGQFPFTMAFAKWFIDTMHVPPTHFWVRFPFSAAGILSVVAAFFCGRSMGGGRLGLVVALLVSVNPFFIQVATEAYHYSFVILGAFLMMWVTLDVAAWALNGKAFRRYIYVLNGVGFFLMTYSQPSGWGCAFLLGCTIVVFAVIVSLREKRIIPLLWATVCNYLTIGVPLLFVKWGLPQLRAITTDEHQIYVRRIFGIHRNFWGGMCESLYKWGWGYQWWGIALLVLLVGMGIVYAVRTWQEADRRCVGILVLLGGGAGLVYLSTSATSVQPDARYLASYSPAFFLILGAGVMIVMNVIDAICARVSGRLVFGYGLPVCIAAIQIQPALWCTQLDGKPIPYKGIQTWFNTHLPKGTLVVVDRWFEPWCELRTYSSTNVVFTFTVPSEPPDMLTKSNWRQTVRDFVRKYPDAAYLEVLRSYEQHLGPWDWPAQYFKHKVVLRNEAGAKLFDRGLQLRGEGVTRNAVQIYYNKREDVLKILQASGEQQALFYGEGWGYTKLWRQIPGDFRDWRVLQGEGALEIHNLTDATTNVAIAIRAVALNGNKRVRAPDGSENRFSQGRIEEWLLQPISLKPGLNQVTIVETPASQSSAVLLVEDVGLRGVPKAGVE